jgi:hypothetical protein
MRSSRGTRTRSSRRGPTGWCDMRGAGQRLQDRLCVPPGFNSSPTFGGASVHFRTAGVANILVFTSCS